MLAPETNPGREQIIPNNGPHEQIYIERETAEILVFLELIEYDPHYGPNAKVYRPVDFVDAKTVRSWLP